MEFWWVHIPGPTGGGRSGSVVAPAKKLEKTHKIWLTNQLQRGIGVWCRTTKLDFLGQLGKSIS